MEDPDYPVLSVSCCDGSLELVVKLATAFHLGTSFGPAINLKIAYLYLNISHWKLLCLPLIELVFSYVMIGPQRDSKEEHRRDSPPSYPLYLYISLHECHPFLNYIADTDTLPETIAHTAFSLYLTCRRDCLVFRISLLYVLLLKIFYHYQILLENSTKLLPCPLWLKDGDFLRHQKIGYKLDDKIRKTENGNWTGVICSQIPNALSEVKYVSYFRWFIYILDICK